MDDRYRLRAFVLSVAAFVASCGGDSPSSPGSDPAPETRTVILQNQLSVAVTVRDGSRIVSVLPGAFEPIIPGNYPYPETDTIQLARTVNQLSVEPQDFRVGNSTIPDDLDRVVLQLPSLAGTGHLRISNELGGEVYFLPEIDHGIRMDRDTIFIFVQRGQERECIGWSALSFVDFGFRWGFRRLTDDLMMGYTTQPNCQGPSVVWTNQTIRSQMSPGNGITRLTADLIPGSSSDPPRSP